MEIPRASALALFLAVTPAARAGAPPADAGVPLKAGDTVSFDLTALPERFEGEAKATCIGTRIAATGPVEARCVRHVRFEVRADDAKMAFVFRPSTGGRAQRIELPLTRSRKAVTFLTPAAGTLLSPEPTVFPEGTAEKAARAAAEPQCGLCRGEAFRLQSVEVTKPPLPPGGDLPVRLGITAAPRAP